MADLSYGGDYDTVTIDRTIAPGENLVLDILLPLYPATVRGWLVDAKTYRFLATTTLTITDAKKTQTMTIDSGFFDIGNITPFKVTITVASAGYETSTQTSNITNVWTNYFYIPLNPLPPSPPAGFTATAGKGYVNLAWNANSEGNLANYQIYRSTAPGVGYQLLASTNSDKLTYADGDVIAGTAYYYVIKAVNTAAQQSGYSAEVSAMPEALPAPTGLTATPGKELVNLAWEASAENHISSYNIYRTAEPGGDYALIGSIASETPAYSDFNVAVGVTYTYVVTAVNEWSKESGWSNPAAAAPEELRVSIAITSPAREYSATPVVIVKGTVASVSAEVGVVLVVESTSMDGVLSSTYLAEVNGNSFAASIALFPGALNTIRAIATLPDGEQADAAISLYADRGDEVVKLTALPSSGIISAQTKTFDVSFEAEVNLAGTIINYAWDFDGDGSIDQVTSTPAVTFGYTGSGIFYPTVTVTNDQTNSYTASTVVNVLSVEEMNRLLKGKWEGMKGALAQGDIETAIRDFAEGSRDTFRQQFTLLSKALPQIVGDMGEATLIEVRGNRAISDLRTIRNGSTYSFQLEFIRAGDGLWRIRSF